MPIFVMKATYQVFLFHCASVANDLQMQHWLQRNHSHMTSKNANYFKWLLQSQNEQSKASVNKDSGSKLFGSRTYRPEKEKSHSWCEPNIASM
jgi:hypothetical protein